MLGHYRRVLMIGAHPDDEDTELLTVLVRGMGAEAAYLSLNRGEGGQNLIGPELGEALGLIRTEELLAARRLDGARQYFTRAYDFGYSKTLDETWEHWPADTILKDVVRIVRRFRPQIIVSIFSGDAAGRSRTAPGRGLGGPRGVRGGGRLHPVHRSWRGRKGIRAWTATQALPQHPVRHHRRPRSPSMAGCSTARSGSRTTRSRWRGAACTGRRTWGGSRRSARRQVRAGAAGGSHRRRQRRPVRRNRHLASPPCRGATRPTPTARRPPPLHRPGRQRARRLSAPAAFERVDRRCSTARKRDLLPQSDDTRARVLFSTPEQADQRRHTERALGAIAAGLVADARVRKTTGDRGTVRTGGDRALEHGARLDASAGVVVRLGRVASCRRHPAAR